MKPIPSLSSIRVQLLVSALEQSGISITKIVFIDVTKDFCYIESMKDGMRLTYSKGFLDEKSL